MTPAEERMSEASERIVVFPATIVPVMIITLTLSAPGDYAIIMYY